MSDVTLTVNGIEVRCQPAARCCKPRAPWRPFPTCATTRSSLPRARAQCVVEVKNPDGSTRLEPACSCQVQTRHGWCGPTPRACAKPARDHRADSRNHPRACQTCNPQTAVASCSRRAANTRIDGIRYEGENATTSRTPRRWPSRATLTSASCVANVCGVPRGPGRVTRSIRQPRLSTPRCCPPSTGTWSKPCACCAGNACSSARWPPSATRAISARSRPRWKIPIAWCWCRSRPACATIGEVFGLGPGFAHAQAAHSLAAHRLRLRVRHRLRRRHGRDGRRPRTGGTPEERRPVPLITSCSPGWVKFMEHFYQSSFPTCRAPSRPADRRGADQTFFASATRSIPPRIFNVSVNSLARAKKFEKSPARNKSV